ncbi:MAG TPA: NAD(P)/FAD-dependent oxidoreductase [Gemmatimonadaceae bacterium]
MESVVIVGAGAAGLSAAGALKRKGIDAVVLEEDRQVGGTWARRYDRLHLHTAARFSGLAHYGIPRGYTKYPSRDQFVEYLREYADYFGLHIITDCKADRISQETNGETTWTVSTNHETFAARSVVIATGQYRTPMTPTWPGLDSYAGKLIHSSAYSNGLPYKGKRVLVVGAGNSGTEIATDLAEHGASFVAISIRSAPPLVPRDPFGIPISQTGIMLSMLPGRIADAFARTTARLVLGDLTRYGIPRAEWGPFSSKRVPVIDVGFVQAVKDGQIKIRSALESLTSTGAIFVDGKSEPFDAVIAATGFRTGLPDLLGPNDVLDHAGEPLAQSGGPTSRPGLFFTGYIHSLRGHLFEANLASKRLAKNVRSYLDR